jgi:hypothetical protein
MQNIESKCAHIERKLKSQNSLQKNKRTIPL